MSASEYQSSKGISWTGESRACDIESAWKHVRRKLGKKEHDGKSRWIVVHISIDVSLALESLLHVFINLREVDLNG